MVAVLERLKSSWSPKKQEVDYQSTRQDLFEDEFGDDHPFACGAIAYPIPELQYIASKPPDLPKYGRVVIDPSSQGGY